MVNLFSVNAVGVKPSPEKNYAPNRFKRNNMGQMYDRSIFERSYCQSSTGSCSCYQCSECPLLVLDWENAGIMSTLSHDSVNESVENGILEPVAEESYFVYSQINQKNEEQFGILASIDVKDCLSGLVKGHENITCDVDAVESHLQKTDQATAIDPISLMYRESSVINEIIARVTTKHRPVYTKKQPTAASKTQSSNGSVCKLWMVVSQRDILNLKSAFASVGSLYIADGHHRVAAACKRMKDSLNSDCDANVRGASPHLVRASDRYITAMLFPDTQMTLLPFNRCVRSLNGLTEEQFLTEVSKQFTVNERPAPCFASAGTDFAPPAARSSPVKTAKTAAAVVAPPLAPLESPVTVAAARISPYTVVSMTCSSPPSLGMKEKKRQGKSLLPPTAPMNNPRHNTATSSQLVSAEHMDGHLHVASMYLRDRWYDLSLCQDDRRQYNCDVTSAKILSERVFSAVLQDFEQSSEDKGCGESKGGREKTDNIIYVDGTHSESELRHLVDTHHVAVAFSLPSVTVQQIMSVSDRGMLLPPKTTFFHPKPLFGVMMRFF